MKRVHLLLYIAACTMLLFCSGEKQYNQIIYSTGNPGDICIRNLDTGESRLITDYEDHDGYPACSPDGKKIAFYAYFDGGETWSINIMNIDGTGRKRLTYDQNVKDTEPVWSPDGTRIAFGRKDGDNYSLWIMDADGGNLKRLENNDGLSPCFITNNRILYYTSWDENGEIFAADLDGNNKVQLTDNRFIDAKPKLSPDGRTIAFMTDRHGNFDIYTMNIDGSNETRLTTDESDDWAPRWSPDGNRLAFLSGRDGDFEIFIMNRDGSELTQITKNDYRDIQPDWIYPQ